MSTPSASPKPLAIITGANSGFGYGAAEILLARGCDVILACRSTALGTAAAAALTAKHPACGAATVMALDLSDLTSVCAFAAAFLASHGSRPLTYLINNAGLAQLGGPRTLTAQGFEVTVGVNHLGHAALFNLLLPHLKTSGTRIVAVGSLVHTKGRQAVGVPLDAGEGLDAYANSKLLNTVWGFEVHRRYSGAGVSCNSGHPGSGLYTGLGGKGALATVLRFTLIPVLTPLLWLVGFSQTWHDGGVAEVAAADAAQGGLYFYRHWQSTASATAGDAAVGAWVWAETHRLLREAAARHGLPEGIAGEA